MNWLIFTKKLRYIVETWVLASQSYIEILKYKPSIKILELYKIVMPIDLKAVYGELSLWVVCIIANF